MEIRSVEFLTSYAGEGKVPDWNLPEIAVVGRSNSGKSSFINAVLGRKQIAHVSSKPGKTTTVNYFVVNADFIFTDLPGYGFAKRSKRERETWKKTIDRYFNFSPRLRLVIIIIDVKVGLTELDAQMTAYCAGKNIPFFIIANKMDKLNQSLRAQRTKELNASVGKEHFLFFSALKKRGVEDVLSLLDSILQS
jgi:GTP-binding protein